ncbi:MAG: RNase adapter RapZ [Clostridiaceae bacterium]|nr:RNase adapter RapZ [Clostridiaceae bacterium]
MDCLIISGMSGAGKSLTVDVLEDIGYYCVDNMPVTLIPRFAELFMDSSAKYKRVAFVVDVRSEGDFERLFSTMDELRLTGVKCSILFLDCSDESLLNRYKETRRRHPLDTYGKGIVEALAEERRLLEEVKARADYLIDTTVLSSAGLRSHLMNMFCEDGGKKVMVISINTFGFKYGIPHESDMVFDVRFLKNPYYVPELRDKNGMDKDVYEYVFNSSSANIFAQRLFEMLDFLIPLYIREGRTSLVVSIGCTGGHHRSVALGEKLYSDLYDRGHNVIIRHRDIQKG